jgi:hypothetical protein
MNKNTPYIIITAMASFVALAPFSISSAENQPTAHESASSQRETQQTRQPQKALESFTGKITKNRVRLRLVPNLEGSVISELNQGAFLLVVDETDDFYAVEPTANSKAYVFRTYVLDNIVEGTHVNIRLKPDTESPVVTQLNSGDRVEGNIDPSNSKWLEIAMPKSVRFYVAKEYVEKVGDRFFLAKQEKRLQEANRLLIESHQLGQTEFAKSFDQMNIDLAVANYKKIIQHYADFPDQANRAKEALSSLQNAYSQKKLAYLEQNQTAAKELKEKNEKLATELKNQQNQMSQLKQQLQKGNLAAMNAACIEKPVSTGNENAITFKMSQWGPVEQDLYTAWANENDNASSSAFYEEQMKKGIKLSGMIEAYNRPVKNKPGDYLLVNSDTHVPAAFLYSTQVNLQDFLGQEVTLLVAPRANNNYAHPAYYVLTIQ